MQRSTIKAIWAKRVLHFAKDYAPLRVATTQAAIRSYGAQLERSHRISWVEFGPYLEFIEGIRQDLGDQGLRDFLAAFMLELRSDRLYRPLLRGIDLFGGGAESMLRLYAHGHTLAFRGTGSMRVEERANARGVSVILEQIPAWCQTPAFVFSHCGGVEGGFKLAHSRAEVHIDQSQFRAGRLVFEAVEIPLEEGG